MNVRIAWVKGCQKKILNYYYYINIIKNRFLNSVYHLVFFIWRILSLVRAKCLHYIRWCFGQFCVFFYFATTFALYPTIVTWASCGAISSDALMLAKFFWVVQKSVSQTRQSRRKRCIERLKRRQDERPMKWLRIQIARRVRVASDERLNSIFCMKQTTTTTMTTRATSTVESFLSKRQVVHSSCIVMDEPWDWRVDANACDLVALATVRALCRWIHQQPLGSAATTKRATRETSINPVDSQDGLFSIPHSITTLLIKMH